MVLRHFRLGLRDGVMVAVGFWAGLTALSNAVDIYHWGARAGRRVTHRRKGFLA